MKEKINKKDYKKTLLTCLMTGDYTVDFVREWHTTRLNDGECFGEYHYCEFNKNSDGSLSVYGGDPEEIFKEITPLNYTVGSSNYPVFHCVEDDEEVSYYGDLDLDFIQHLVEYGYDDPEYDFDEMFVDIEKKLIEITSCGGAY